MPKDTFYNLSDEKKKRIFDAAVQEFSTRRFSEASMNQIVKNAKIPWGSFYQYFQDKEDVFRYVYEEMLKEKRQIMRQVDLENEDIDVFEACLRTTRATFQWSKVNPEYSRIGMLMELDNSEFITKLRVASTQGLKDMVERDKARGIIKPEVDSDLVVDMIYALIMKEYFWTGLDEELFYKKLNAAIQIIKEGIAVICL